MEDQRPGPGDLTDDEPTVVTTDDEPTPEAETDGTDASGDEPDDTDGTADEAGETGETGETGEGDEPDAEADGTDETEGEGADDPESARPRRTRVRRPRTGRRLAVVSAALFVAASAATGAALQPYLADRADVAVKQHLARTASRAITTLWNYTPDDIDTLPDRATVFLGGDMAADYRQYIDGIIDLSKQQRISNTTNVVGVAVESIAGPEASVLVYTNTTATVEPQKTMPATRYMSYRVQMRRQANRWVVTRMVPVTQLSITPRG